MKGDYGGMFSEVYNMRVKWLEYENLDTGLKIERIDFFDDLTLLVGLSGAGKTQILNVIEFSAMLATNRINKFHNCKAKICFQVEDFEYEWSYQIKKDPIQILSKDPVYIIDSETLKRNENVIFSKDNEKLFFIGYQNIPLSNNNASLIFLCKDNNYIKELSDALHCFEHVRTEFNALSAPRINPFKEIVKDINEIVNLESPKNIFENSILNEMPSVIKLYIAKKYYSDYYDRILSSISSIFPEVVGLDMYENEIKGYYCLEMEIRNGDNTQKITQENISSGMLRSINYIIELYTVSPNSLIIIDEFENGLGMNCIGELADLIQYERSDLQFIITSHHPKLIGSIDYDQWKIIERENNIIHNYSGDDKKYDLGGNRHDAYFNLLNHWDFEGKI